MAIFKTTIIIKKCKDDLIEIDLRYNTDCLCANYYPNPKISTKEIECFLKSNESMVEFVYCENK